MQTALIILAAYIAAGWLATAAVRFLARELEQRRAQGHLLGSLFQRSRLAAIIVHSLLWPILLTVHLLDLRIPDEQPATARRQSPGSEHEQYARRAPELEGQPATVVSPLRPIGTIKVHGEQLPAKSSGEYLNAGARVTITGFRDGYFRVADRD
jgi:membrane-bound ClpP family serine protease